MTGSDNLGQGSGHGRGPGSGVVWLAWLSAMGLLVGLAGFGAWIILHWPWAEWLAKADEQARQADQYRYEVRQTDAPVEVADNAAPPHPPPLPVTTSDGSVVQPPHWAAPPRPNYPELAQRRGVENGVVVLKCEALVSGEIGACEILSEIPAGAGFGEAAVAGTRTSRLSPQSLNGFKTDSTVQFTVRFKLD